MPLPPPPQPCTPSPIVHVVDPDSDADVDVSPPAWKCPVCDHVSPTPKGLRSHYDKHHTPADPTVTTVYHSTCPTCQQIFVTAIDAKQHKCPAAIHSVEQLEQVNESLPILPLFPSPTAPSSGWILNTDGSGPKTPQGYAGWGVAIWSANEQGPQSTLPTVELFGPVPLQPWDVRWLGATVASNNTGELTAMAEALLWLDQEAPGDPTIPALIRFDSTYAFEVVTGRAVATENTELVSNIQTILLSASSKRNIEWAKVKGHSNDNGNDYADKLAELGAAGKQTKQWSRWLLPVGSPSPCDPLLTDYCWKCGIVYSGPSYARQLAGHEAYCSVPSAPPPSLPCRRNCGTSFEWQWPKGQRKQAHHAREFRNKHEISFGDIPNSSSIDILLPYAIFDYIAAFLRNGFAHVDNVIPVVKTINHMAAPVKVARQQTPPELSGTF